MKELPQTKGIALFGKETLKHLKENHCLVLDLTKLTAPENDHFEQELAIHGKSSSRKHFPKGLKEFVWSRSKLAEDLRRVIQLAGSSRVVLYGFHERLPEIVKALTDAEVKHWIVLSNTQHTHWGRETPTPRELELFAEKLAGDVKEIH